MKRCSKCGVEKDAAEFTRKGGGERRHSWCKVCEKAYREANREKIRAYRKAYHEANREKVAASKKAYYEANREKVAASKKAHYEANTEKDLARNKAWRDANREKFAADRAARYKADPDKYRERAVAWRRANPEKVRTLRKAEKEKSRNSIDDAYVKKTLKVKGPVPAELIEAKREQLKMHRAVKQLQEVLKDAAQPKQENDHE